MQKKIVALTLALVLAFSMAVSAAAATPRYASTHTADIKISFSGMTANCGYKVTALKGSEISATMNLYRVVNNRPTLVNSWSAESGTTNLTFSDTYEVSSRGTYMITVSIDVDGPNGVDEIYETATTAC